MEIYLDNSSTTKVYPECAELAASVMTRDYGNPSSLHRKGQAAEKLINEAKHSIAETLRVKEKEIYFVSGGTEGDNLAILGTAEAKRGNHIITSAIEHPAVLNAAEHLEKRGYRVDYVPVDKNGRCNVERFAAMIRPDTVLASVMLVNNEIGTVQPIKEMSDILKKKNPAAYFHTDAVQGFGKLKFSAASLGVDLITISSHKIHGPKGMGALYVKEGTRLAPVIFGGGQQNNLRPGTENVPGIAGFGLAAKLAYTDFDKKAEKMNMLRLRLKGRITEEIGDISVNTPNEGAAPHILNVSFKGARSEVILHTLEKDGIYVSSGSACSSHKKAPSYVLGSIGLSKEYIDGSIRFSLCEFNTEEEIDYTVEKLKRAVEHIRKLMKK